MVITYYGEGAGKSSAAMGHALRYASQGKTVYVIRFLKEQIVSDYLQRLEPELKIFRFERLAVSFDDMTEDERTEEKKNILNGINYAHKVLGTGECDLLVLDEVLGAVCEGVLPEDDLLDALKQRASGTDVILTGREITAGVADVSDQILEIQKVK